MAVVNNGDVFLVTLVGSIAQQVTMNTFSYRWVNIPPGLSSTTEDVYTAAETILQLPGRLVPLLADCCPSNWTLTQLWIQKIHATRVIKYNPTIVPRPGLRMAATIANASASITRKTETATRRGIGGIRICATPADSAAGLLLADYKVVLTTLAQEMLSVLDITADTGGVLEPVLFSRPTPTSTITTPLFSTEVTQTSRVVRRRTVGLGI